MKTQTQIRTVLGSLTLLALFLMGCAKMPEAALNAAQAALAQADSAEANIYVPDMYQAAQDSMAAAQAEMTLQASKLGLSRSYVRTRQLLDAVASTARTAANAVEGRKEQMRTETDAILANLPATLRTLNNRINQAARRRATRAAADSARQALGDVNKMLTDARAALTNEDLVTAHTMAVQAQTNVQEAQKLLG